VRLGHGLILLALPALPARAATNAAKLEALLTALAPAAGTDPFATDPQAEWNPIAGMADLQWRDAAPRCAAPPRP
jgi:hypothetical protein